MRTVLALSLAIVLAPPASAQPAEIILLLDCFAFSRLQILCSPPGAFHDSADRVSEAFMSEAIRVKKALGIADRDFSAIAVEALKRQIRQAGAGSPCDAIASLWRTYGPVCLVAATGLAK